jgi:glycosyltransferase involved in cell wall biosynthesis
MTVSILLATTGRSDAAKACVQSAVETTGGHEVEIVVAVDCDVETVRALESYGRVVRDAVQGVHIEIDSRDEYRGSSRAWNDALALSTGDPVVLAADDLEFRPGWLEAALETLSAFPGGWGFVGFNDGHWRDELSTHYLMSRRFIVEHLGGVIAWDCYRHSFNDREANERAKRAGRYAWCEDAHVPHRHWIFGERPQDSTDTRLLGEHGESQRIFDERQAAGFPDEQEAVIH